MQDNVQCTIPYRQYDQCGKVPLLGMVRAGATLNVIFSALENPISS